MKLKVIAVLAAVLAALLVALPVVADEVSENDRFQLWNDCKPVFLVVHPLSEDAEKIELTEERIRTTVESRLRGARIYADTFGDTVLYVRGQVAGGAFIVRAEFLLTMSRPEFADVSYPVGLWESGGFGMQENDAGYILQAVAEHTDKFINEYLRVNAEACT